MKSTDCVVIGAGLSGLAAAITLQRQGLNPIIIESSDHIGGRVKTILTPDDFINDVGFQVILSSYPELKNFVHHSKLNLQSFDSGALIFNGKTFDLLANPVAHPQTAFSTFFNDLVSFKDKALVLKLIALSQFQRTESPFGNQSTISFLKEFGFSSHFIEMFWRPFLTGIFLDSDLSLQEGFFKFLLRCFSTGQVCIPEKGMAELPRQLASQLPADAIQVGTKVKSWTSQSVTLADGKTIQAKHVICAFNPRSTAENSPENEYRNVTTHYFTGEDLEQTGWGRWLVLVPKKFGYAIDHFCLISSVSQSYGHGKNLLSASLVGKSTAPVSQIIFEIEQMAQRKLNLKLVSTHTVSKALPSHIEDAEGFKVIEGVVYCGDQYVSPSINGALKSGRLAAEFIIRQN